MGPCIAGDIFDMLLCNMDANETGGAQLLEHNGYFMNDPMVAVYCTGDPTDSDIPENKEKPFQQPQCLRGCKTEVYPPKRHRPRHHPFPIRRQRPELPVARCRCDG